MISSLSYNRFDVNIASQALKQINEQAKVDMIIIDDDVDLVSMLFPANTRKKLIKQIIEEEAYWRTLLTKYSIAAHKPIKKAY